MVKADCLNPSLGGFTHLVRMVLTLTPDVIDED
jgi:hypothetical protein